MRQPYKYTVDDSVLHVFVSASKRRREELLRILDHLAVEPHSAGDSLQLDDAGRVRSGEFANVSEYIRHCIRVAELVEARSGPRGASFATRQELEHLLDEGMESPGASVTANDCSPSG